MNRCWLLWSRSLLLWLVVLTTLTWPCTDCLEITVDPLSGTDSLCISGTNDSTHPCKTLNHALGNSMDCRCKNVILNLTTTLDNVVIKLGDGVHTIGDCIAINFRQNVTIEAENSGQAVIECGRFPSNKRYETGLSSCHTNGLTFRGIVFQHCGPYTPNVFLNRTTNVLFEDCIFRNNTGAPLRVQFVPSISLRSTSFLNNFNQAPTETDTENTTISELFDSITTAGGFTYFSRNVSVDIEIFNCTFSNNSAGPNDVNNTRPVLLKANGHGGGLLIRLAQIKAATITIVDCTFSDNEAEVDGGAVYFSLSEGFSSSHIILRNNTFRNNQAGVSSGGAVSLNLFRNTFNNSFAVEDCLFESNHANAGGGFGIALYDTGNDSITYPDLALFDNCKFTSNRASNEGTAVGLFALVHVDEVGFPVDFTNCIFENNTSTSEHSSALVAFRFPTNFNGHNHFIGNKGGGITLLNTILRASGTILFESNTAVFGGGLAMDDRCLVEVRPNVNLTFINNIAEETGGAIHVIFPAIRYTTDIFNRLCFLQYRDPMGGDQPPHLWENVTVSFYNNSARLSGAAIYASDMQLCSWLGPELTTGQSIIFNYPDNLTVTPPFHYSGNRLTVTGQEDERLATAPHRVHVIPQYMFVQPGETVVMNVWATDQLDNRREAIYSLGGPHGADKVDGLSTNNESVPYQVPSVPSLTESDHSCDPSYPFNGSFALRFSLPGTSGLVESVGFNFSGCHPGYSLDTDVCTCRCDTSEQDVERCDSRGRYIFLRSSVWANESEDGKLITARVQPSFVNCERDGQLPGCRYQFDDPNAQCTQGREGILCGQCADGYAVTLDLLTCTPANDQCAMGLAVFLILYVVVIIIALLVLIFDTELPNELKGFVFYAQVIGLVYRPFVVLQSQSDSSIDPLGVFLNLLGFSLPFPVCVSPSLKAHHVALLGYITPVIGVLMVLGYIIGARRIKLLSNHSALKGITFLSIFVYKYIADTSFVLISCSTYEEYGFVFQYDGSQLCTGIEFGFFVLFGLIVVVVFVFPAPFAVGYICKTRPKRFYQYADVLTEGLKNNRRWFGGYDLARRLPFVIIGYFTVQARPSLVLLLMSLFAMAVLLVHLLSKPYENNTINMIEALILTDLVAVTVVFLDPVNHPVPQWLRIVLLLLPYLYATLYITRIIAMYIWKNYLSKRTWAKTITERARDLQGPKHKPSDIVLDDREGAEMNTNGGNTERSTGLNTGRKTSDTEQVKKRDGFEDSCRHLREPLLDS